MTDNKKANTVIGLTLVYLAGFGVLSFFSGRTEPLYYTIVIMFFALLIARYRDRIAMPFQIILGLSLLAWMIPLGGNIFVNDARLFDFWIVDNIFRYDNLVHVVFSFVAVLATYHFLGSYFSKKIFLRRAILYTVLIVFVAGIGTIIEVVELIAVLAIDAGQGVGSYLNNAFDLVFNFLGAGIGTMFVASHHKKRYKDSTDIDEQF